MERRMLEDVERVVSRLRKEDVDRLMHSLDHCLLMANKFSETRKPEYYIRMKSACEAFLEILTELEKANRT